MADKMRVTSLMTQEHNVPMGRQPTKSHIGSRLLVHSRGSAARYPVALR
jgi:hypothetical protein